MWRRFNKSGQKDYPPCGGCPDRTPGCHDRCERYKAW